jgi:hypothetical protein
MRRRCISRLKVRDLRNSLQSAIQEDLGSYRPLVRPHGRPATVNVAPTRAHSPLRLAAELPYFLVPQLVRCLMRRALVAIAPADGFG